MLWRKIIKEAPKDGNDNDPKDPGPPCRLDHVVPGQLVEGKLDLVLGNDITTLWLSQNCNKAGLTRVSTGKRSL